MIDFSNFFCLIVRNPKNMMSDKSYCWSEWSDVTSCDVDRCY